MNKTPTLAFIGAGNMARAIIGGLIENEYPADSIWATEPSTEKLSDLKQQGMHTTSDNNEAVAAADVIVLAVKPQILKVVASEIEGDLSGKLFISVAAGISSESINTWLGGGQAIVRCMPNTPSLVQLGASGLFANTNTTSDQKQIAEQVLSAVGIALWVEDEEQLHAITAVSGSGPAYYFLFMEAMIAAGIKQGLTPEVATQLTLQTAKGAAEMAVQSEHEPSELRRRVTSPNGTTEQAILNFQKEELEAVVERSMQACAKRSVEIAKELGEG